MARKPSKNIVGSVGDGQMTVTATAGSVSPEMSMSPTVMRALRLRVIELEGLYQGLKEELGYSLIENIANDSAIRRERTGSTPGEL